VYWLTNFSLVALFHFAMAIASFTSSWLFRSHSLAKSFRFLISGIIVFSDFPFFCECIP
jgi:hypothetical protein